MNTRTIAGRTLKTLDHVTQPFDLLALHQLTAFLARNGPIHCIEVGSWVGESAVTICAALPHGSSLTCVDHWNGTPSDRLGHVAATNSPNLPYQLFLENTAGLPVTPIRGNSVDIAHSLPPQNASLIFIDAEHTYDALSQDIDAWTPHLAPDAVLAGHDYHQAFPGVIAAVDHHFGTNARIFSHTSIWYTPPVDTSRF